MAKNALQVHFTSVECFPMAKVGGLADVVGALPKYLNKMGADVSVFMPRYYMKWFQDKEFDYIYRGKYWLPSEEIHFGVAEAQVPDLGFKLYVIDIPGKFDRDGVYSDPWGHFFSDEVERFIAFQRCYLYFILHSTLKPDIIHCHDHHTGLIPFMIKHCHEYRPLSQIPTVFTIHNQRYQGQFGFGRKHLIPEFDKNASGLLEWNGVINPLASAVKCSWKVTTVSPSYMDELKVNSFGLEWLFNEENSKSVGILNGIDNEVWDPKKDEYLAHKLKKSLLDFKRKNKEALLSGSQIDLERPLVAFIGRFASEKGADLVPTIIGHALSAGLSTNFIVLGTGDKSVEHSVGSLGHHAPNRVSSHIMYDERLSHQIYAGADFLIMPSRVEPCGLNQMYAMRYGTIPIVHDLGGLRDSVQYFDGENGTGIKFDNLNIYTILGELQKAEYLYSKPELFEKIRSNAMSVDLSWDQSAKTYYQLYKSLI